MKNKIEPAHSAVLDPKTCAKLYDILLAAGETALAHSLRHLCGASYSPEDRVNAKNVQLKAYALRSSGDLECDDDCVVSLGYEDGAYVQCWKWVPFK